MAYDSTVLITEQSFLLKAGRSTLMMNLMPGFFCWYFQLRNDVGDCHPIRNVYDVLISDVCRNAVSLVVSITYVRVKTAQSDPDLISPYNSVSKQVRRISGLRRLKFNLKFFTLQMQLYKDSCNILELIVNWRGNSFASFNRYLRHYKDYCRVSPSERIFLCFV